MPAFNELKQVLGAVQGLRRRIIAVTPPQLAQGDGGAAADAPRPAQACSPPRSAPRRSSARPRRPPSAQWRTSSGRCPELTTKLGSAIESIDSAAQQLRKTGEEAQGTIQKAQPVLERGDAVARDAGEVFNAAKRVWPLSDSFNEITDRELPIDSFDARSKAPKN